MGKVWNLRLDTTQKIVLLKFADCADDDGNNSFPGVVNVGVKCGMSYRTVQRTVKKLIKAGLLVITKPANRAKHVPTMYRVDVSPGDNLTPGDFERLREERRSSPGDKSNTSPGDTAMSPNPSEENHPKEGSKKNPTDGFLGEDSSISKPSHSEPPIPGDPLLRKTPVAGSEGQEVSGAGVAKKSGKNGNVVRSPTICADGEPFDAAPFFDIGKKCLGICPSYWAKFWKQAAVEFGQKRSVEAWQKYVNEIEARFNPTAPKFVATIITWLPPVAPPKNANPFADMSKYTPDDKKY